MSRPDRVEQLDVPADAIPDVLDHAEHPDHTLEHVLGPRPATPGGAGPA
jgi:hypothetical protein